MRLRAFGGEGDAPLSSDDGVLGQTSDVPPEGVDVLEPIGLEGMQFCSVN